MECSLVMFKSDGTRRDIPLVGERNVIGRMSACQVRIPLDRVSREHCELVCDGGTLQFTDLNSSNGVMHNGAKSKKGTLKPGDELVVGPVVFTVMIDGQPTKITPIRTIVDQDTDEDIQEAGSKLGRLDHHDSQVGSASASAKTKKDAMDWDEDRSGAKVTQAGLEMAAVSTTIPATTVLSPKAIGSSAQGIEAIGGESDFEEFNAPPKPATTAKTAAKAESSKDASKDASPQEKDELAPMWGEGSGTFEFMDDGDGGDDEEEAAFTFE